MCGIWAVLGEPLDKDAAKHWIRQLKGRGPEGSRIMHAKRFQLGFSRLAINGLTTDGMQPMSDASGGLHWICNGEIYNAWQLASDYSLPTTSGSDCEVIGHLLKGLGAMTDARTVFRALDGVFATVIIDSNAGIAYVARDPYGIRPLFIGYQTEAVEDSGSGGERLKRLVFASELKALPLADCQLVEPFPPGHYAAYDLKTLQRIGYEPYHTTPWIKQPALADEKVATTAIRCALESAVEKRLMTERPCAALLSGGLDSSLIAALVQRHLLQAGKPALKTFSIGFEGSEDLRHARLVADWIRSDHTEIVMTPEEFWAAVPSVVRDIESFDITTVRASVGNYLVSREIAARTDCKVVFNGDGSDEVLGGYMYFYKAPSDEAFEAESGRLLEDIHLFDVLRSDRSISSHGLEPRTPFLDKQFVATARAVATKLRRPVAGEQMEKYILRTAFDDGVTLPREVLWRKKEAFSDGVSGVATKSWYQICQEKALTAVGEEWAEEAAKFTHLQPLTAEAYYYRKLFDELYKTAEKAVVPYHWMPRWTPGATDPSARTLDVYKSV
jgi:asparagine synthase (glutamine-hydrolysing)